MSWNFEIPKECEDRIERDGLSRGFIVDGKIYNKIIFFDDCGYRELTAAEVDLLSSDSDYKKMFLERLSDIRGLVDEAIRVSKNLRKGKRALGKKSVEASL